MIFVHLDFTASQYISMSVELYHARKKALNYHDHHICLLWSGTFAAGPSLNVTNSLQPVFKHFPASASAAQKLWLWLWLNLGHAQAPKGSQNSSSKWRFSFSINAI